MVIYQVIDKFKLVLLYASQYLTEGKNDSYFRQLRFISSSILPASSQTD